MAPYITHLLVAERTVEQLGAGHDRLGAFLYGSIVPDVSAEPNPLTHRDTHFVDSYQEDGQVVFRSTAAFLAQYEAFTTRPPSAWRAAERAFLEGYLCHLSADEAWWHMLIPWWQARRERYTRQQYYAAMTVFDQRAASWLRSRTRVLEALRDGTGIEVVRFMDAPLGDDFRRRVCDYLAAGGGVEAFLQLARGAGESEAWVRERRRLFLEHRDQTARLVKELPSSPFLSLAVERSLEMMGRFRVKALSSLPGTQFFAGLLTGSSGNGGQETVLEQ